MLFVQYCIILYSVMYCSYIYLDLIISYLDMKKELVSLILLQYFDVLLHNK